MSRKPEIPDPHGNRETMRYVRSTAEWQERELRRQIVGIADGEDYGRDPSPVVALPQEKKGEPCKGGAMESAKDRSAQLEAIQINRYLEEQQHILRLHAMAGKKAMLEDAQRTRRELLRELPIDHSDRRAIEGELEELSAQVAQIEAELPQPVPPPIVDVPTKGQSPAAIPGETGSREADKGPEPRPESREIRKAERTAARDAYKAKCRAAGVKVTDNMIAEAANPKWHSRTQVQKWLVCDPRYDGEADRLIRKVFTEKPHLPKKA